MTDYSDKTDEELIREYRLSRNTSFLNALFTRHADVGFRTAMRYMRNQSDAEDVLQLAFIQFLENLPNYREGSATIKPWLMKMIVNASLCKLREEKRRSKRQQAVASARFLQQEKDVDTKQRDEEREELRNKIKIAVDTLPEKYRSPIWLVLYEGFSYPEVATVLALPEKTVRTQVARGLEKLKELMGSYGSVLSVTFITQLIAESELDVAPLTIKKIIDSPTLYQSASIKTVNGAAGTSFFSIKYIMTFMIASLVFFGGAYLYINNEKSAISRRVDNANLLSPKIETSGPTETNFSLNFLNEADRSFPLLAGKWQWSEKTKFMVPPINEHVFYELPIEPQEKCFVIETTAFSLATVEQPNLTLNLLAYWSKELVVLEHESEKTTKYTIDGNRPIVFRTYVYKNYISSFAGNQFVGVRKYQKPLKGAKILFLVRNYSIQKISSKTLTEPPKELLNIIEESSLENWETKNSWQINKTEIKFNDPQ